MENISETNTTLQSLSRDLASVVEQAGTAVVAVDWPATFVFERSLLA